MDGSIDSVNDEHPKNFYSESTSLSLRFDLKNILKLRLALKLKPLALVLCHIILQKTSKTPYQNARLVKLSFFSNFLQHTFLASTIGGNFFWQITVFPCKFEQPQVKRNLISSIVKLGYEFPHELRLRILAATNEDLESQKNMKS